MIEAGQRLMLKVEFVLAALAAACLLAVMGIVFVDVGARYFLNSPLAWSYELIGMYLMPALFYLALSDTLADHHHIAVDLLRSRMSDRLVRVVEIVGCGAMAALFLLIVWIHLQSAVHDLRTGAVTMGVIEWPAWVPAALVVVGSTTIALRLLGRALGHLGSLVTGRPLIALPAIVEA
jgi:TRAP-type C4-dicarboxylate transport system permease small subunit